MTNEQVNPSIGAEASAATTAGDDAHALRLAAAFEQALPATTALREAALLHVNIDVPNAIITVLGALPKILAYRAEAQALPRFDIAHFDKLELYARALAHAHARFLFAATRPGALLELIEAGVKLRDTLCSDALALAHRGLVPGQRIAAFKGNTGYKNIAFDLLSLASLLRMHWDNIASRSALQLSELDAAESLAQQLIQAVGTREQAPSTLAQAQAQRQRNFTLFSRSYSQVRRAIGYLRFDNEDVDKICPSLYAGRGGSRRKDSPHSAPTATPSVSASGEEASAPQPDPPISSAGVSATASSLIGADAHGVGLSDKSWAAS